jgi:DMSO/TMAO reductase YedYZ heme-binding membrane subunit
MSSPVLWYATRATGLVALLLLTATMALGVLTANRFAGRSWPGFAQQDLHRRVSLLSMVFLTIHVLTAVTDSFVPIGWAAAVVPFTSSYRRLWVAIGTVGVDLMLAVVVSSLLRHRMSASKWRALHWLAYASWPVAVVHAVGMGTDIRLRWVLFVVIACIVVVAGAVGARVTRVTRRASHT